MVSFEVTMAICSKVGGVEPQATFFGVGWLVLRSTVMIGWVVSAGAVLGADEPVGDGGVKETEKVAVFEDTAAGLSTTSVPVSLLVSEAAVTVAGAVGSVPGALKVSERVGPFPVGSSQ